MNEYPIVKVRGKDMFVLAENLNHLRAAFELHEDETDYDFRVLCHVTIREAGYPNILSDNVKFQFKKSTASDYSNDDLVAHYETGSELSDFGLSDDEIADFIKTLPIGSLYLRGEF